MSVVNVELIIALIIRDLSDLVQMSDSGITPDDLFSRTFNDPKVGLSNEQMPFFKANLAAALPQAAQDIARIDENAALSIGEVADLVRASLAESGVNTE